MGEGRAVWPEQLDAVSLGVLPGTAAQMLRSLIIGRLIVEEHKAITDHLLTLTGPLKVEDTVLCRKGCATHWEVEVEESSVRWRGGEDELDALA